MPTSPDEPDAMQLDALSDNGPIMLGGLTDPDPVLVASVLNRAEVSTIGAATEFLYSGANPIQTGVVAGTIDPVRAAVVKGRVLNRLFQPLSGVTVSVLGRPELGQTLSRVDGGYDLAVNGGGAVSGVGCGCAS